MKLPTAAVLATVSLLFTGCLREDPSPLPRPLAHECTVSGVAAPLWACGITGQKKGMMTITAKVQTRHPAETVSFKKVRPTLRKGLHRQIDKSIKKKVDRYVSQNGGFDTASEQKISARICSDVAYDLTEKLREVDRWNDPAQENIYILTGIEDEYVSHTIKRFADNEMLRFSPLEKWVLLRTALNQSTAGTSMRIPAQHFMEEPPFMAEEPMVEVVDDSFVGINKNR